MPELTRDEEITQFVHALEKMDSDQGFNKCVDLFTELYDAKSQIKNLEISLDSKVASYTALLKVLNEKGSQTESKSLEKLKTDEAELKAKENHLKQEPTFN